MVRAVRCDETQADRLGRLEIADVVLHELCHAIMRGKDNEDEVLSHGAGDCESRL